MYISTLHEADNVWCCLPPSVRCYTQVGERLIALK